MIYKPIRLEIRQPLLKWIPTPDCVDRTTVPSHSIKLSAPVSFLILAFGSARFNLRIVPLGNGFRVYKKAPEDDMSWILRSNSCFFLDIIASALAGRLRVNRSKWRKLFIYHFLVRAQLTTQLNNILIKVFVSSIANAV